MLVLLICFCPPVWGARHYTTTRLQAMASLLPLSGVDTLSAGTYTHFSYQSHPLIVRVNVWNEVEHIGLQLFEEDTKTSTFFFIYDFLERYLLEWNLVKGTDEEYVAMVKRYIRIDGRPLFIIYRPAVFDKNLFVEFTQYLRRFMTEKGVGNPYLIATKAFGFYDNPQDWGLDAVMEFELNNIYGLRQKNVAKIDDAADFRIYDWAEYIYADKMIKDYTYKTFHSVFPRWDNTPRKAYSGALIFDGASPDVYGQWLDYAINDTLQKMNGDERIVFINAWNEWAEGAMLEPDKRFGYAYLDMTRKVLDGNFVSPSNEPAPIGIAVLTGGINRIEKAIQLLNDGVGERLLISGVRPGTSLNVIASRKDVVLKNQQPIDLGYEATDTVGNAKEVREWTEKYHINEFYVVTSFYHIPRSRLELQHEMPDAVMHFVAVDTPNVLPQWWKNWRSFKFMAAEYTKFLIVYLQYAFD